jgi:hypothetical protein
MLKVMIPDFFSITAISLKIPPYFPDFAPCEFTLVPKLKMKLKEQRFETVSDIQRVSEAVLNSIMENDFHSAFEAWEKRWDHCVHSQGDYFEGDGSQNF